MRHGKMGEERWLALGVCRLPAIADGRPFRQKLRQ